MKTGEKYDVSGSYDVGIPIMEFYSGTAQPITLFNTIETQIAHPESSNTY